MLSIPSLLVCLALFPANAQVDPDMDGFKAAIGKITAVEYNGQVLVVKVGSKKYRVTNANQAKRYVHGVQKLGEIRNGSTLWVLGRYQPKTSGHEVGQSLDPQIIQITAMVTGPFSPPTVSKKLRLAKTDWMEGSLTKQPDGRHFELNGTNMQIGADRAVIVVTESRKVELEKGALVRIWGKPTPPPETDDKKQARAFKRMTHWKAGAIDILTKKAPKKEYPHILGTVK